MTDTTENPTQQRLLTKRRMIIGAVAVLLTISILFLINRFVFSGGGLLFRGVNLCKYKSIAVPTKNGNNQPLAQSYDLKHIAAVMRTKPDYEVNDRASGGVGLIISRTFDGVKYNIVFDRHKDVYEMNLNTYNFGGYPSGLVTDGEKCTTPTYSIEKRVFRIIDDMPLNPAQQAELKENVRVVNVPNIRITF